MRYSLLLSLAVVTGCVAASPRQHSTTMPNQGRLASVAGGTYSSGGGTVDLTYVLDPAASLCFASTHVVAGLGASLGPLGIAVIDCCRLQNIAEVQRAMPALHLTCAAAPADAK